MDVEITVWAGVAKSVSEAGQKGDTAPFGRGMAGGGKGQQQRDEAGISVGGTPRHAEPCTPRTSSLLALRQRPVPGQMCEAYVTRVRWQSVSGHLLPVEVGLILVQRRRLRFWDRIVRMLVSCVDI